MKNGPSSHSLPEPDALSRRERQLMDIVYSAGSATAREIWEKVPDRPTYATVRTILRVLLEKGQLTHRREGRSFVYMPSISREKVAQSALQRILQTFFEGSVEKAVTGLLDLRETNLAPEELKRIEERIDEYKKQHGQTS